MTNVVILGMHRSGTSMVAGALANAGLFVGLDDDLLRDQDDNPHGFYERTDVVSLNDAILAAVRGSWFDPPLEMSVQREYCVELSVILDRLSNDGPWLLKDPRMCLTWPVWEAQLTDAHLLYVYRNPLSVAKSLASRHGFPYLMGLALWEYYNSRILEMLQGRQFTALSFDALSENPPRVLQHLEHQLAAKGVTLKAPIAAGAFDAGLRRSFITKDDASHQLLTESQQALALYCESLCDGQPAGVLPSAESNLLLRINDLARAMAPLSDAIETRLQLAESRSLCEERTAERDEGLVQLKRVESDYQMLDKAHQSELQRHQQLVSVHGALEQEHSALANAHTNEVARHEALIEAHNALGVEYRTLGVEYRTLQEKAQFLFELVTRTFENLLAYELSFLGRLGRLTRRSYRLLTFRRGQSTAYEDSLAEARHHFEEFELQVPERVPGKLAMVGSVVRYVAENPAGSARSFSLPRLKRAAQVFLGSDAEDVKVWVDSRFPDRDDTGYSHDGADDASLDTLELVFPKFDEPRVSIIVPVYNQYRATMTCLRSVLAHTDMPYEVILADDCSTDLTETITERVENLVIARGEHNLGFLRNCNAASQLAKGDYVLLLNNDTAVTEGWLEPMVGLLDDHTDIGITGPKLLFADGKLQEAGGIMWRDASAWNFGRADDPEKPAYSYVKDVDYISGACLLVRKSLWDDLGGFDERYVPAYYEDADIAFAARAKEYRVVYQPASKVFHFEGVSNGTDLEAGIKQHQVTNQAVFRDKWAQVLDEDHFDNAQHVFWARDRSREQRSILFIDHYVPHHDKDAGSRSTQQYVELMVTMGYKVLFMGANFFPHKPYTEQLQQLGVEVLVGESTARGLERWLADHAPYIDNIYLHRPHVAEQFLSHLQRMAPRPKIVFFGHDLHYLRVAREADLLGDDSLLKDSADWRKREYAVFDQVDTVYYPSQAEVDELASNAVSTPARAIPLYAMNVAALPEYSPRAGADILFVGGFNHPPNVDAVSWFVDAVMPLLVGEFPEIRFHIVGSNPTDTVQELQGGSVQVYGYLSDEELAAMYRKVQMAVVPLRFGAGVKGKVLEAIQMNVPLITTPTGAEGIPEADKVMQIAEDAQGLATAIKQTLAANAGSNPESLEAMSARMANYLPWLRQNFSRDVAAAIVREDFGEPLRQPEMAAYTMTTGEH